MHRLSLRQIAPIIILAALFIAASYSAHRYESALSLALAGHAALGVLLFIFLTAVFVVFVIPLDIAFLIPIAAALWGPVATAVLSITGWTIGAALAFGIARYFGLPVVEKLIGLSRVRAVENRIPKTNLFWMVVFLRMLVSVDILSYALGLFSGMNWGAYILATAFGVAPFGFFFAYAGTLPFWYEIAAVAFAILIATLVMLRYGLPREP
ncbi:MAG: TVP38/TMEM64 family protein [Minisyncoccia bacterium]